MASSSARTASSSSGVKEPARISSICWEKRKLTHLDWSYQRWGFNTAATYWTRECSVMVTFRDQAALLHSHQWPFNSTSPRRTSQSSGVTAACATHPLIFNGIVSLIHDPLHFFNGHDLTGQQRSDNISDITVVNLSSSVTWRSLTSCIFFRHSFPTFRPSMTFFSIWTNSRSWTWNRSRAEPQVEPQQQWDWL